VLLSQEPDISECSVGAGPTIRVSGVRKAFPAPGGGAIQVLEDVSFLVCAGQLVAIMGASGAGKSTLLHLIGNLETPDSGTIAFNQLEQKSVRPSTSFVFQFHYLLSDLTAAENVTLPLMIERVPASEAHQRALHGLAEVGLVDRRRHKIGDLSGGEQQRVAVARALVTRPVLVLADEPTGNLDTAIAEEIGTLLAGYCRRNRAMAVIATHNPRLAQICDRILVLERGRLRETGP
jgi:lipoprotein-releasing system ATP-binding protein